MATVKKPKTIHYKNVVISGGASLQTLLRNAIGPDGTVNKPIQRQQKANEEDTVVIFVNKTNEYNGMTIGQLVYLEKGKHQQYITVDDEADYYSIDAMSSDLIPEVADEADEASEQSRIKKRKEFIESILYFGVIDNHIVIIQSAALSSRQLEAHLSWLLGTCTSYLDKNASLVLQDKPAESVFKKMEMTPAKSIHVGAPLTTDVSPEQAHSSNIPAVATNDTPAAHASKVRFQPAGPAASLIRAIAPGLFEKLELEESLDEANIHVSLEITYNRKTTKTGQSVIDQIATSLRHSPASDVVISLQGGGKITGNELKLSGSIRLEFLGSGLINEAVLFHEMHKWLYTKIESSEIDATSSGE